MQALLQGMSQREAYKTAYDTSRMKDKTVDEKASRLFAESKVRARFEELQDRVREESAAGAVASALEVLEELTGIGLGRKDYPSYDMFGNEHLQKAAMPSRIKALELLAKHHALLTERVQHSGGLSVNIVDDLTDG